MNLIPFAQRLQDAGLGVMGDSIFVDQMPIGATTALMLRSPLSGVAIDNYLPGFYRTRFQVIARAPTYDAGQALINQALKTLKLPADSMIDTMTINFCRPVTLPVPFPLSSANLIEWSTNFEICFTDPGLAP